MLAAAACATGLRAAAQRATVCASGVAASSAGVRAFASAVPSPSAAAASASAGGARSFSRKAAAPPAAAAAASPGNVWKVDDPYSGEIVAEVPQLTEAEAAKRVHAAEAAYLRWRPTHLPQRMRLLNKWCAEFTKSREQIALDVSRQMGKPLSQARSEVDTAVQRAQAIIEMAQSVLSEDIIAADANSGLLRKITKEPIGVVLSLMPWNYPLLCAVNTVVTALLCGNSVLLKHSDRAPAAADWFEKTFHAAGAPKGLVSAFHADHALVQKVISNPAIAYVHFTGSVAGGRAVYSATAASRFIDVGLELGGKDPAYIASDADLQYAIANVVDGGNYNAGQSCCAVERVYVHEKHYDAFLSGAKELLEKYELGDPQVASTTMGPLAQPQHPAFLRAQVEEALKAGARLVTGGHSVQDRRGKGRFFQPTLLADCTRDMRVVREESFGPILAVSSVKSDEEAVAAMNDSDFGLTASVWSSDVERATRVASQLQSGTVFMNRCDFLDPHLAWSGRKDSGKGIGLSTHGFAPFLRTKSYNFKPLTR